MDKSPPDARPRAGSRREFVKRAVYAAPVLLTLPAVPALAQGGSGADPDCPDGWVPFYDQDGNFLGCES